MIEQFWLGCNYSSCKLYKFSVPHWEDIDTVPVQKHLKYYLGLLEAIVELLLYISNNRCVI